MYISRYQPHGISKSSIRIEFWLILAYWIRDGIDDYRFSHYETITEIKIEFDV